MVGSVSSTFRFCPSHIYTYSQDTLPPPPPPPPPLPSSFIIGRLWYLIFALCEWSVSTTVQDQVNRAPYFMEVFRMFTEWLESKGLTTTHKFAVVTDW